MTGLGQSHGLGASGTTSQQQTLPPASDEPKTSAASSGSDILDTSSHELRLDKSNILMLGPSDQVVKLRFSYCSSRIFFL